MASFKTPKKPLPWKNTRDVLICVCQQFMSSKLLSHSCCFSNRLKTVMLPITSDFKPHQGWTRDFFSHTNTNTFFGTMTFFFLLNLNFKTQTAKTAVHKAIICYCINCHVCPCSSPKELVFWWFGGLLRAAGVQLISRVMHITSAGLYARLFTNLSGQTADSEWSRLFPRLNHTDTISAGVQMSDWEIVAVYLSWIVPLRGGSILLLSDERSEKANSYHQRHISSN